MPITSATTNDKGGPSGLTDEQWSEHAKLMGSTPEAARSQYESFLKEMEAHPELLKKIDLKEGQVTKTDAQLGARPSLCLFNVICINFDAGFSGGSDWKASLSVNVTVFGQEVWRSEVIHLDPKNSFIHLQPGGAVFKVDIEVGLRGADHCLYIKGSACYWAFISWRCSDTFDKDLVCFG